MPNLARVPTAPDLAVWGYDTRQRAVHHVINKTLISLCNYIIIPYKMFPINILLNYTNVKHNVIVLCYLPPPVMSCLVISYFPDGVFSITCITFFWTTTRVPCLRQPAPDAERNNISHLYSFNLLTTINFVQCIIYMAVFQHWTTQSLEG